MTETSDYTKAKKGFLTKAKKWIGKLPFIPDAVAMYYCMLDPDTPLWAKSTIAGALVYFIIPVDAIPDFLGPVGFTDDAAVIATAFATVEKHVTEEHKRKAKAWLKQEGEVT